MMDQDPNSEKGSEEQQSKIIRAKHETKWMLWIAISIGLTIVINVGVSWFVVTNSLNIGQTNISKPGAEGAEVNFARDMIAHHQQAVEMALLIRDRTNNNELKQLALDILLTQQAQIGQMQGWLNLWGYSQAGTKPPMNGHGAHMMGMATPEQITALSTAPVKEAEVSFLQLMIKHHRGGVRMAKDVLNQTNHLQINILANAIIKGQESEIAYMENLLKQLS